MATPQRLNWGDLSPQGFEELVYDLLGELGYTNVDWRKGTPKRGFSPDSGRDVQAELRLEDPDGGSRSERWFVQAKHHSSAVSPTDFDDALTWASAERPDVLLLAVSALSNPSKQYIEDYQRNNKPAFRIRVWERPAIERLLARFPELLRKYFPEQNPARILLANAMEDWTNHGVLLDIERLRILYDQREELGLNEEGRYEEKYVVLLSEQAHGDAAERPWLDIFSPRDSAVLLPLGALRLAYDFTLALENNLQWAKLEQQGATKRGVFGAISAVAARLLRKGVRPSLVAKLLWEPHKSGVTIDLEQDEKMVRHLRKFLMELVLRPLLNEAVAQCSATCGSAILEERGEGVYRIETVANVPCKLSIDVGLNENADDETPSLPMCPAWVLAMGARGWPPSDRKRITRRELWDLMKALGLLLSRGAALADDPNAAFEPASLV